MRTYSVPINNVSFTTAITVMQIVAGTNLSLRLIAGYIQQTTTTTNAQQRIQLIRKSVAATVTAVTPVPFDPGDAAAVATAGVNATVEGTNGVVVYNDTFSLLTGWWWKPIPEEFVYVPGAGIIALLLPSLTTNPTAFTGELVFQEMG